MSQVLMTHHEYEVLNAEFGHRSTQFYHSQDKIAEEYRSTHNDQLPSTPFWNYLTARYDIDPSRFDKYHPVVGKWIKESEDYSPPVISLPSVPAVCVPVVLPYCPPPSHQEGHGAVPEPSGMVLLAIAVICGAVFVIASRKIFSKVSS
jgi:hypothetical protein